MHTPESQQALALSDRERLEGREGRLVWAASIANAAVLLALIGLIGNVTKPDAAIQFLRWPIVWLGFGVMTGGGCAYLYAARARRTLRHSDAEVCIRVAHWLVEQGRTKEAVFQVAVARSRIYDNIELAENHKFDAADPQSQFSGLFALYIEGARENWRYARRLRRWMDGFFWLGMACLAIASATPLPVSS
ncbi:hypothetical protein [Caulobacter sp.]|uniref:hypothetical protein n=1 Tax=Caulobacter sp. TaxID=78 RepID=UPI002B49D58E|nr:hypothetical protein [Caulobacter sp.]HJV43259.1 hypothetical protein [Caulobacter sp.]